MQDYTRTVPRIPTAAPIDWVAAERAAQMCGPRTRRLVATRNLDGLRVWLMWALELARSPEVAAQYTDIAVVVGVAPSSPADAGDVDRHGDIVALGGAA